MAQVNHEHKYPLMQSSMWCLA